MVFSANALACSKDRQTKAPPCPDGATVVGKAPPDGFEKWCQLREQDGTLKRHGNYRAWHPNGQLQAQVSYRDGVEHGPTESWYDTGHILGKGQFKNGKPHGTMTTWHQNGQKQSEKRYKDGAKHGLTQVWDRTGRLSAKTNYANDQRYGLETLFEADGSRRETMYADGEEQSNTFYGPDGNEVSMEEYVGMKEPTE